MNVREPDQVPKLGSRALLAGRAQFLVQPVRSQVLRDESSEEYHEQCDRRADDLVSHVRPPSSVAHIQRAGRGGELTV